MDQSFFWYDLETTGTDPVLDRVIQFAGQRTDSELNPIDAPINFYVKPSEDTLFHPDASRVTGIDPAQLETEGLSELAGIEKIQAIFMVPGTCGVGFNSLKFDDEFLRQSLYRSFFDPYAREWMNGNSRWDLIDLARLCFSLRPEGIQWPTRPDGRPSFKLVDLSEANGLSHIKAHDALSDIEATLGLARLLKRAQPRLFDYYFKLRQKTAVKALLYPLGKQPILQVAPYFDPKKRFISPLLPFMAHPSNANSIICLNLDIEPDEYVSLSSADLRQFFSFEGDAGQKRSRPLQTIALNRSPAIAPISTIEPDWASTWGWSKFQLTDRIKKIQSCAPLHSVLLELYASKSQAPLKDAEYQLYSGGFISDADRSRFEQVRDEAGVAGGIDIFDDQRLNDLYFNYKARHYPEALSPDQRQRWQQFLQHRWMSGGRLEKLYARTLELSAEHPFDPLLQHLTERMKDQAKAVGLDLG